MRWPSSLLIVGACHGGQDPSDSDTGQATASWVCPDLQTCYRTTLVRTVQTAWPQSGHAIDTLDGRLVFSGPNYTYYQPDSTMGCKTTILDVDLDEPTVEVQPTQIYVDAFSTGSLPLIPARVGAFTFTPGDVTGNGSDDLMLFSDSDDPIVPSLALFPGAFGPPTPNAEIGLDHPSVYSSHIDATHGARCGDLDGDGNDDIVLDTRVIFGPVQAPGTEDFAADHPLAGPVYPVEGRTQPGCILTTPDGLQLLSAATDTALVTEPIWSPPGAVSAAHFRQDPTGITYAVAFDAGTGWEVRVQRAGSDPLTVGVVGRPDAVLMVDLYQTGTDQLLVRSSEQLGIYDTTTGDLLGTWATHDGRQAPGFRMLHGDVSGDGLPELVIADPFAPGITDYGRIFVLPLPLEPL